MQFKLDWQGIYKNRLGWAYNARTDFYNSIKDEELNAYLNCYKSGVVNISVYGRSQVGKSTLIYKLIGIKEESFSHLSRILRYGRKTGKSVTIVPTIYKKSDNDYFSLVFKDVEMLDIGEEEVINKLIKIRDDAEENKLEDENVLIISIPRGHFIDVDSQLKINIIDLPGIGSNEEKERNYVSKVIKKYIPLSNLILLVGLANQIKDFEKMEVYSFQNWWLFPYKFRLIFTRSVSDDTTQKFVKKNSNLSLNEFNEIFSKECKCLCWFSKEIKFYPLEYGESWETLQISNKEVWDKAYPVIDNILENLRNDINASSSEHFQIMSLTKFYKTVQDISQKRIKEYYSHININEEEKTNLESEIINYKNNVEELSGDIKRIEEKIRHIHKINNVNIEIRVDSDKIGKFKQEIKEYIRGKIDETCTKFEAAINHKREEEIIFNDNSIQEIRLKINNLLNPILNKLQSNPIAFFFGNNKGKDNIITKFNKVIVELNQNINNQIESGRKEVIQRKTDVINEKNNSISRIEEIVLSNSEKIFSVQEEISAIQSKRNEYETIISEDLENSHKFKDILKDEYLTSIKNECEKLNNSVSKYERFLHLLTISETTREYRNLKGQQI